MNFQIIIAIILVAGFAAVIYFVTRKPKADQGMTVMLEWLKEMRGSSDSMHKRMDETNKAINDRLDNAAQKYLPQC